MLHFSWTCMLAADCSDKWQLGCPTDVASISRSRRTFLEVVMNYSRGMWPKSDVLTLFDGVKSFAAPFHGRFYGSFKLDKSTGELFLNVRWSLYKRRLRWGKPGEQICQLEIDRQSQVELHSYHDAYHCYSFAIRPPSKSWRPLPGSFDCHHPNNMISCCPLTMAVRQSAATRSTGWIIANCNFINDNATFSIKWCPIIYS